jgi:hypothetical protein
MLAVGSVPDDQISRLTCGEAFTCCYGSETEHATLTAFCQALESLLSSSGQTLADFSPDELKALLDEFAQGEGLL